MPLDVSFLASNRPQNNIHHFVVVGSTMTEAANLAATGAPHGTVVLADEQTAGIGRFGRHWVSDSEAGIYCSVVLRMPLPGSQVPILALALGLATAEAIEQQAGLDCDLRWPNDVLIGERKAAGILAQLQEDSIIAGIGINVNQERFPDDLRTPATSLRIAGGRIYRREPLIVSLLAQIDSFGSLLLESGPGAILRAFAAASTYVTERRVLYDGDNGPAHGITAGLNDNGFLKVRDASGSIRTIYSGGIRADLP
jgi:BirA family transcriptional regulator, biotin operon repressor / biotin---[acetyl-CoA-carboxylase] ligase